MKPASAAWAGIVCGVCAYELAAAGRDWELLSEAADRYRRHHPILTNLTIIYVAGHLLRVWPKPFDPLHRLAVWAGR